jgi:hypothetical protein
MNDDFADLETELRAFQPLRPTAALEARLAQALAAASHPRPAIPWWTRLGFRQPLAAFAWGFATPAAAVCAVLVLHVQGVDASRAAAPIARQPAARVAAAETASGGFEPAKTSNVVYQTDDEGVVYDGDQQPERQVRYRSNETLAWRNPHTGAQVEVSYPREEVVLTPLALR